jgi:hypothetical protein
VSIRPSPKPDDGGKLNVGVAVLTEAECLALLHAAEVGRVGLDVGGRLDVLPVNIALVEGPSILIAVAAGTRLQAAIGHQVVVEVDGIDPDTGAGWSVVARGRAAHAGWPIWDNRRPRPLARGRDHLMRIRIEEISGRRTPPRS